MDTRYVGPQQRVGTKWMKTHGFFFLVITFQLIFHNGKKKKPHTGCRLAALRYQEHEHTKHALTHQHTHTPEEISVVDNCYSDKVCITSQ